VLQLLEDQVPVGLVGRHVGVLQAGAGRRVQHGDVPLQHAAGSRHLVLVVVVFQLLAEGVERVETGFDRKVEE